LRTRLTVASLTPTFSATSASRLLGMRVMPANIRHQHASICIIRPTESGNFLPNGPACLLLLSARATQ
jgi:hypothetical protein